MVKISVVFPVYNNLDVVRVTLPAIANQDLGEGIAHEVAVVDDGSHAQMADWLRSQAGGPVKLVTLPSNRGRSVARNTGVRESDGEAVVFLDSDVIVRPDFLAAHAEALGLYSSTEQDLEKRISLGAFADTRTLAPADHQPPTKSSGMVSFTTANVGIARALLDQVCETPAGPFDEHRFTRYGWEDLDLEQRLERLNPKRVRSPRASGLHYCPPFSTDQLDVMIRKEVDRAAMARVFLDKHPSWNVRLVTQMTPLHRGLWELLSLGGLLNKHSLTPFLAWLSAQGYQGLAAAIARITILNPTYVRHL